MVCIVYKVYIVYTVYMTDARIGPPATPHIEDVTDGALNLADKYRPQKFDDVVGQDSVVTCLSGLIERGRIRRSVLLHGAVGSGKTSLARIYARALTCRSADLADLPCGSCGSCKSWKMGSHPDFQEYNVSRDGGAKAEVEEKIKAFYQRTRSSTCRIFFLDEAHALTKDACDLLLNHVEEPKPGVVFLFATTEIEKIGLALRSRLFDLLVRPLPLLVAIEYLRGIAAKEGIELEPGAIELLAGLRRGYPRDLLLGLDRVWDRRTLTLTVKEVHAAFDIDQTEILVEYFAALADGHLDHRRDRPAEIIFGWREEAADKTRWIQAFLVHLYHNEILSRRLVVDGVMEAIHADVRMEIVQRFCARLGVRNPIDLAPYWRRLLAFWLVPGIGLEEAALNLRLVMFHQLVISASTDENGHDAERERKADYSAVIKIVDTITGIEQSQGFGAPPAERPGACPVPDQAGFLARGDVRRIVHAASFLAQEHGVLFNAAFELRLPVRDARRTDAAVATIAAFRNDLARQSLTWGGELLAAATLLERDGNEVVGRIIAHLREPNIHDPIDVPDGVDVHGMPCTAAWVKAWRNEPGRLHGDTVEFTPSSKSGDAAIQFHWMKALELCAGLDPSVEAWDPALEEHRPLIKLLRIKPRSSNQLLGHPLVEISELLSDETIAKACQGRLEPLSAFDDGAWAELKTGWELEEYAERRAVRAERERRLAGVRQRFGEGTPEAHAEIERIVSKWPCDPRRRRRRWRGWRAGRSWP